MGTIEPCISYSPVAIYYIYYGKYSKYQRLNIKVIDLCPKTIVPIQSLTFRQKTNCNFVSIRTSHELKLLFLIFNI